MRTQAKDPVELVTVDFVVVGATYPIWSPFEAFDAAAELLRALDAQEPSTG